MTYTSPDVDPYPQAQTPAEWLEIAYDNGWMRRESTTANRGYFANIREDHPASECILQCDHSADSANWPYAPHRSRFLGPVTTGSELFQQLMREHLPTLSPLPSSVTESQEAA